MVKPTKWGEVFLVNTTTKGDQFSPTITGLANGRFVAAWFDEVGNKAQHGVVRVQVFNTDGGKAGGEFRINSTTKGDQFEPTISDLADGRFVVAWTDDSGDARAQIFHGDGSKSGGEFRVNTATKGYQFDPTITGLADGRFVVAWSDDSGKTNVFDVRAQIFNPNGSKSGGEFLVNTATPGSQTDPAITGLADGRFVAAWVDLGVDEHTRGIRAQIFNANGGKSGGEIVVKAVIDSDSRINPTITGLINGNFVVTWTGDPLVELGPPTVRAQVFSADGSKSGVEFMVATTADEQPFTATTGLADGRFVIVWNQEAYGYDLRGQVFNADGTKSGGEFLVNTTAIKAVPWLLDPTITALADGRFVVAWPDWHHTGDDDNSEGAIRGQIFDPREKAIDLVGSDGDDQFVGTRFGDIIKGVNRKDWLLGENGDDQLEGGKGRDVLEGGDGKDLLAGGVGKDKLKGGGGADQFFFGELGKENADKITEFRPGKDLIVLDGDVFTGTGDTLGKEQFAIGVIYDKDKGKLFWDGDGKGGAKEMLFAKVDPGLKLGDDDFLMV
jgi:Ca2+-binding RTX toxin-like protein